MTLICKPGSFGHLPHSEVTTAYQFLRSIHFLAKPVQPTKLIGKIQEMLDERSAAEWKNPLSFHVQ